MSSNEKIDKRHRMRRQWTATMGNAGGNHITARVGPRLAGPLGNRAGPKEIGPLGNIDTEVGILNIQFYSYI